MNEIAIIGAGPAGCVAAIILARRGRPVLLVEQHRFPRDKVCGECLSALGIDVLDRLDLRQTLLNLRPVRLTRTALVAPDGRAATIDLPRPMWGLSRLALDAALLDAARAAGATVMQPARCESLDPLIVRDLTTNTRHTLAPRYVLIADGKAACGLAHPRATSDLGVKAHFTQVQDAYDTISLFALRGHYVGLAPIEGARWNVAMSVPAARVKALGGDLDALFARCLTENEGLAERFRRARRISDWLASPLPRFAVQRAWPMNLIPIGNAAAALEPIGGEGMGLAMRSAELAAEGVDAALAAGVAINQRKLRRAYDRLWRPRRFAARAAAVILSSPRLAPFAVAALDRHASLAMSALTPLGK